VADLSSTSVVSQNPLSYLVKDFLICPPKGFTGTDNYTFIVEQNSYISNNLTFNGTKYPTGNVKTTSYSIGFTTSGLPDSSTRLYKWWLYKMNAFIKPSLSSETNLFALDTDIVSKANFYNNKIISYHYQWKSDTPTDRTVVLLRKLYDDYGNLFGYKIISKPINGLFQAMKYVPGSSQYDNDVSYLNLTCDIRSFQNFQNGTAHILGYAYSTTGGTPTIGDNLSLSDVNDAFKSPDITVSGDPGSVTAYFVGTSNPNNVNVYVNWQNICIGSIFLIKTSAPSTTISGLSTTESQFKMDVYDDDINFKRKNTAPAAFSINPESGKYYYVILRTYSTFTYLNQYSEPYLRYSPFFQYNP